MDVPLFGDLPNKRRREINLGGNRTGAATTHNAILQEAKLRRLQRNDEKRRQDAALRIQSSWRGYVAVRTVRQNLRSTFEHDVTSLTALRCLVLLGQDEDALGRWSTVVFSSRKGVFYLQSSRSIVFISRQMSFSRSTRVGSYYSSKSVAGSSSPYPTIPGTYSLPREHSYVLPWTPSSQYAEAHLGVLNILLSDNRSRPAISRYLVSHGFYPLLREAVLQLVSPSSIQMSL